MAPVPGPPPVSLILPNRNNGPVLEMTLERIALNTTYPDYELIAVDDDSSDESLDTLRRWRDAGRIRNFKLLETEHSGVADSLNHGLAHAEGEVIVSLDGDATIETEGWLERMVGLLELDERVGVVSGGIVLDTGRVHAFGVNVIGPAGLHDRPSRPTEPVGQRTLNGNVKRLRPAAAPERAEVDASIGCCMLVRRELVDELGGWDTAFSPVWFEDVDLSLSARRLGAKVFVLPEIEVIHRRALTNARYAEHRGWRAAATSARRAVGRVAPQWAKDITIWATRADTVSPEARERLQGHMRAWRKKWGFDLVNPDMDEVMRRYGDTEVCWAYDDARRVAGEEILARYVAADGAAREAKAGR
jgi:GT2 family glycosyltransferase